MEAGKILEVQPAADFFDHPKSDRRKAFLGRILKL